MKKLFHLFTALRVIVKNFGYELAEKANGLLFVFMCRVGAAACVDRIPNASDFESRRVTNPSQSEVVRQRFFDHALYPTAGANQISFFSLPIGQGVTTALGGIVGTPKTQWDTNLEMGSTLPSGKAFLVESIEVDFQPGSVSTASTWTPAAIQAFAVAAASTVSNSATDVNNFYESGMLELNILSKNYLREAPLKTFPPKTGLELTAAVASNSATVGEKSFVYARAGGRPYYMTPAEVLLQPGMNFEVLLKWPAPVATPSGFNGRIAVNLDGYFMRASQ